MGQAGTALKGIYEPIQGEIARVEETLQRELAHDNPFVSMLLKHSTKFQGKRVRPALLLHSAHILGGEVTDLHVSLAAVVEMLHSATLVHDDVLDEAQLRRQVKTLNNVWGNEASILFGDYLFAKAYTLAAKLHHREANMILARTVEEMCVGELWQISTKFNFDMDEAQYLKVIYHKTGALFATACRLGSVGSGAPATHVEALANYGACFGTAFQIIDDCLDITGDEKEMGKSLGTDLEKGKLTLPVIKLLRDLPLQERRSLQDLLSSRDGAAQKKETVHRMIRERDILAYSLRRATDFVEDARSGLRSLGDSVHVDSLLNLAEFVLDRRI
ncbi:MAG TPA: polyprenyl synthetase family protein [Planctomycetota bacterium]|nr:polyprenyl synthetase family protein [Planctomycetota bacterium]